MYAERRRMGSFQNNMSTCVYKFSFMLSECSSQKEDDSLLFVWDGLDHRIGELMPSDILMRIRLILSDRQAGIQKKYSLLRPFS